MFYIFNVIIRLIISVDGVTPIDVAHASTSDLSTESDDDADESDETETEDNEEASSTVDSVTADAPYSKVDEVIESLTEDSTESE